MNFDQSLAKLARHIASKATQENTSFSESVDAFKALIAYFSALKKNKTPAEDTPGEPDFMSFQSALEENSGEIRSRAGRGRDQQ